MLSQTEISSSESDPQARIPDRDIEDNDSKEEDEQKSYAPDGGWGWIVVLSCFVAHIFVAGFTNSFGVLSAVMMDTFNITQFQLSWVRSIMVFMQTAGGTFSAVLVDHLSCRIVCIAGAIVLACGLLSSLFVTNIYILYLTFGALIGGGLAMVVTGTILSVNQHFDKKRSLSVGIGVTGGGLGVVIFPLFINHLLDEYSWWGSILIIGGVSLNMICCGATYRPVNGKVIEMNTKTNVTPKETLIPKGHIEQYKLLLKCVKLWVYIFSVIMEGIAMILFQTYVPDFALDTLQGLDRKSAALILSVLGITNCFGRLILGCLSAALPRNAQRLRVICLCMCGLSNGAVPLCRTYPLMLTDAAVYGFFLGGGSSLQSLAIVEVFGINSLSKVFGILSLFQGTAALVGAPLASWVAEKTSQTMSLFLLACATFVLSGLLLTPFTCNKKKETENKKTKSN